MMRPLSSIATLLGLLDCQSVRFVRMYSKETCKCNPRAHRLQPSRSIALCCLMCEGTHKQTWKRYPLLPSSNTSTNWAFLGRRGRQQWRESAKCDVSWRSCKCYKFKRANVVLILATNCEFNQTKLGRGGGECVEEAPKVSWWCEERKVSTGWMRQRRCNL